MGQPRFDELLSLLPRGVTVLGIDENTGVVIDPAAGVCELVGQGGATVLTAEGEQVFGKGSRFPTTALGDWRLPPTQQDGIPGEIWERACAVRDAAANAEDEEAPEPILALAEQRQGRTGGAQLGGGGCASGRDQRAGLAGTRHAGRTASGEGELEVTGWTLSAYLPVSAIHSTR